MALIRRFIPSEKSIQELLYHWLVKKQHKYIVPNCGAFGWEADLLSFTQKNIGIEYEIKISRSDFKSDAKKKKHKRLKSGVGTAYGFNIPHQFYYVVPKDMVTIKEIPAHAGLIYVHQNHIEVVKKAPKLHQDKIRQTVIEYVNRGLMLRYWSQRKAN